MENLKLEICEILDCIFEEKTNFKYENNYITICSKLKDFIPLIEKHSFYSDFINEKENNEFLKASRKNLIRDNNKQYKEMIQYRDENLKLQHKIKILEKNK